MTPLDPVEKELLQTDLSFRDLYEEHQQCKQRLGTIRQKTLLCEEDEIEIKRIKLHKLSLKDQMAAKVRAHVGSAA